MEGVLLQHIGVSSVVVGGVPDTRLTEMVVACVQLRENWTWVDSPSYCSAEKDNQTLTTEILQRFCREKHLTRYFSILNHISEDMLSFAHWFHPPFIFIVEDTTHVMSLFHVHLHTSYRFCCCIFIQCSSFSGLKYPKVFLYGGSSFH